MGLFDSFTDVLFGPDIGGQMLFGDMLDGGDKKGSNTGGYTIRDGRIYLNGVPSDTGIPVSDIPGTDADPKPGNYRVLAEQVREVSDLLPYYTKAVTGQLGTVAQAELDSAKQTSPQYAQLMTELYRQYGPQLNQIGSDIARQNALNQANQDLAVITGPGGELVNKAYDLSQVYDKPYYDTRALTSSRLGDLLNSIDLGGGLSDVERREIEQSLALQGGRRGTYNAPSSTEVVGDAMTYGAAGRNRVVENQDQLSKAIAASAAFLPAAKSGVDVFQVATGRPSIPNSGESKFTGIDKTSSDTTNNLAQGLLGTTNQNNSNTLAASLNAANIKANEKDWLDKFVQFSSGLSNVTSAAGGIAGMCFIAREVYGVGNPRWFTFRNWLFTKAPTWFFKLYMKHGEQFAKWISNKPRIKSAIRFWMNKRIGV